MKSSYIKACLSAYYRFAKQHGLVATECGYFNSDFLTIKNNTMTEIEIKVSKADMNADFKKPKHRIYTTGASKHAPNYFYFCVPPEMLDYAVAKCVDKPYGVMVVKPEKAISKQRRHAGKTDADAQKVVASLKSYCENFKLIEIVDYRYGKQVIFESSAYFAYKERIRVVKRAKKMNNNIPSRKAKNEIVKRLASEMANLRIEFERQYNIKSSEDK